MAQRTMLDIYEGFATIRRTLGTLQAKTVIEHVYTQLRSVNFCAGICVPLATDLRVLPVPEIGWSD